MKTFKRLRLLLWFPIGCILGATAVHLHFYPPSGWFFEGVWPEAAGIIFTIIILDTLASRRETKRFKDDLIYRMGSAINDEAIRASEELYRHGWLRDGTLKGANLSRANLNGAMLVSANLSRANLNNAQLQHAELMHLNLQAAELNLANLQGSDLTIANMQNCQLHRTTLEDANMFAANLVDATISVANLRRANLQDANLAGAKLIGSDLTGAILKNTNMLGAKLYGVIIDNVIYDKHTTLPDGSKWLVPTDILRFIDWSSPLSSEITHSTD